MFVALTMGLATLGLSQPAGFVISNHLSGLTQPTCIAFAPNGTLYVGEKTGTIKVFGGTTQIATFATIACSTGSERGLLGLAFDPNFATNHFVYAYYTTNAGNPKNRVSRFTELNNVVVPASEQVIVDNIASDAGNHNAGCIRFGLDGKLYIATGDGGSTPTNSQDLGNLSGKILRVNADGTIPNDNPFFNQPNKRGEIYLYGLRNPFRFSFRPGTNTLYVADVGQSTWEEVNVGVPGGNYGWNLHEGTTGSAGFVNPIHQYNHNGSGASITGGCFVGDKWPAEWQSRYLFADYVLDSLRWLEVTGANAAVTDGVFSPLNGPVDFALGPDGAVYAASLSGVVYRIAYRPLVTAISSANVYGGLSGQATVTLDVPAPVAGQRVNLTSSNPTVLTVPASISVLSGQTSAQFTFNTVGVPATQPAIVTAAANGSNRTKTIYVLPAKLSTFTLSPLAVVGGTSCAATLGLLGQAPAAGLTISLSSGNTAVAQVPASVAVNAGSSAANFTVTTSPVLTDNNVSISASLGSTTLPRTIAVVVQLHRIASLTMTPNPVVSGTGTTGRISITRPAPVGGLVIALTDNASIVTTPPSVTIPPGGTVTTFAIGTTAVNTQFDVNVQASVGVSVKNTTLTVTPSPIQSLASFPATVPGGISTNGQVVLRDPAPAGGALVSLSDGSAWATLPPTATVAAGATAANFTIATVPVTQNVIVTLSASYLGSTRTATMTITNLAALTALTMSPSKIKGGTSATGTVTLTKNAPSGGVTVTLSDNLSVLTTPASVRVGSGSSTQTFVATSVPVVTSAVGTVIATANGIMRTATITVIP